MRRRRDISRGICQLIPQVHWREVPKDFDMVMVGYCGKPKEAVPAGKMLIHRAEMCLHAYILSQKGAKMLLDTVLPCGRPIDICITDYYRDKEGVQHGIFLLNGSKHPSKLQIGRDSDDIFGNGIAFQDRIQVSPVLMAPGISQISF
ncbi:MAG: hypothetical protein ACYCQJ_16375 [Nitrososphaerales archaeon]